MFTARTAEARALGKDIDDSGMYNEKGEGRVRLSPYFQTVVEQFIKNGGPKMYKVNKDDWVALKDLFTEKGGELPGYMPPKRGNEDDKDKVKNGS